MFLTFETLTLLERVGILCIRFIVKPCLPNPMLCFRYQKIRHTQVRCTFDISPERGTKGYCDTMCLRTYPIYSLFFTSHILLCRLSNIPAIERIKNPHSDGMEIEFNWTLNGTKSLTPRLLLVIRPPPIYSQQIMRRCF